MIKYFKMTSDISFNDFPGMSVYTGKDVIICKLKIIYL